MYNRLKNIIFAYKKRRKKKIKNKKLVDNDDCCITTCCGKFNTRTPSGSHTTHNTILCVLFCFEKIIIPVITKQKSDRETFKKQTLAR